MEVTATAPVEAADPTQAKPAVPASPVNETQAADADMAAALKAFKSAMGAPESAPEAPKASAATTEPPKVETPPVTSQEPPKANEDLTAILARMQRFEDDRKASEAKVAELQQLLAAKEAELEVKDPIQFLKKKGFTKEQVEDWLLNGDKSAVVQKSELELLKERVAKFEAAESERSKQTEAQKAEAARAAAEQHYKTNTIGKALDAAKYPLLHKAHTTEEIINMAYATAADHYRRTGGQEPAIGDVLGKLEGSLKQLHDKLTAGAKPAAAAAAPALSDIAARSQAGTGGTEPEDDASALKAAAALAKQFLTG